MLSAQNTFAIERQADGYKIGILGLQFNPNNAEQSRILEVKDWLKVVKGKMVQGKCKMRKRGVKGWMRDEWIWRIEYKQGDRLKLTTNLYNKLWLFSGFTLKN